MLNKFVNIFFCIVNNNRIPIIFTSTKNNKWYLSYLSYFQLANITINFFKFNNWKMLEERLIFLSFPNINFGIISTRNQQSRIDHLSNFYYSNPGIMFI